MSVTEEKKPRLGDAATRLLSVLPIIPLILWLLFKGPLWGFQIFVAVAVFLAGREFVRMFLPGETLIQVLGALSSVAVAMANSATDDPRALPSALVGASILALVYGLSRPDPVETAGRRIAALFGGPVYVGLLLSHVAALHALPDGGGWVMLAMMLAWFSDTAAYFAGRAFGKNKLYPKLSPKKTREGALGGLCGSVLGAVAAHYFLIDALPLVDGIVLALFAGAAGQAGDLFESLLKRSAGVKDSGNILPGHGGLLDRVDALMFTATFTFLYANLFLPAS